MPNPAQTVQIQQKLPRLRIETSRDGAFTSQLNRLLMRSDSGELLPAPLRFSTGRETRGVMVVDGPGGGKTTLVGRALEHHPAIGRSAPSGPHYLEASVPSLATFKSMGAALLHRSGLPVVAANREGWSMWETLRGPL